MKDYKPMMMRIELRRNEDDEEETERGREGERERDVVGLSQAYNDIHC